MAIPLQTGGGIAMNRLPVIEHLPPAAIARRYRTCPDGAEKTRWQVLWLVTRPDQPMSAGQAARSVGLTPSWGRTLLKRWNARGPDGLTDGRRANGADYARDHWGVTEAIHWRNEAPRGVLLV